MKQSVHKGRSWHTFRTSIFRQLKETGWCTSINETRRISACFFFFFWFPFKKCFSVKCVLHLKPFIIYMDINISMPFTGVLDVHQNIFFGLGTVRSSVRIQKKAMSLDKKEFHTLPHPAIYYDELVIKECDKPMSFNDSNAQMSLEFRKKSCSL